jgi:hypothetical protein
LIWDVNRVNRQRQQSRPLSAANTARPHQPPQARRIGQLEAERARLLARLPARQRELIAARQAGAAEGQGSDKWVFPAPILGERAFREREREAEEEEAAALAEAGEGGGSGGGPTVRVRRVSAPDSTGGLTVPPFPDPR